MLSIFFQSLLCPQQGGKKIQLAEQASSNQQQTGKRHNTQVYVLPCGCLQAMLPQVDSHTAHPKNCLWTARISPQDDTAQVAFFFLSNKCLWGKQLTTKMNCAIQVTPWIQEKLLLSANCTKLPLEMISQQSNRARWRRTSLQKISFLTQQHHRCHTVFFLAAHMAVFLENWLVRQTHNWKTEHISSNPGVSR